MANTIEFQKPPNLPEQFSVQLGKRNYQVDTQQLIFGQPAFRRLIQQIDSSRYHRREPFHPSAHIYPKESYQYLDDYTIQGITDPEDPLLKQSHQLFVDNIGEQNVDPLSILQRSIAQKKNHHIPHFGSYKVYVAIDKDDKVISASLGIHLPLNKKQADKSIYIRAYTATEGKYRQTQLGTQVSCSANLDAILEAQLNNSTLAFAVSEALPTTEDFLNRQQL